MSAAELRDRVVAVLVEDLVEELLGARDADGLGLAAGGSRAIADLVRELVEEQPAQRLRGPRVAGEERALDRFRQVGQRENVPVEIREVGREPRALGVGEGLGGGHGVEIVDYLGVT